MRLKKTKLDAFQEALAYAKEKAKEPWELDLVDYAVKASDGVVYAYCPSCHWQSDSASEARLEVFQGALMSGNEERDTICSQCDKNGIGTILHFVYGPCWWLIMGKTKKGHPICDPLPFEQLDEAREHWEENLEGTITWEDFQKTMLLEVG